MDTQRDSLGFLTTPSGYSARSVMNSPTERLRAEVGDRVSARELAKQMARLNAEYGPLKDLTADQVRVKAAEWLHALDSFGWRTLDRAVNQWLRVGKWWPKLSEIYELCKSDDDSWRDALGLLEDQRPAYKAESEVFARDGRTEAEEIAHRIAQTQKWKADAGLSGPTIETLGERMDAWAPASDGGASETLKYTCAARRARGLPTCEHSCSRSTCAMREAAEPQHRPLEPLVFPDAVKKKFAP